MIILIIIFVKLLKTYNQFYRYQMHGRKKVPIDEARKIKTIEKAKSIKKEYEKVMEFKNNIEKIPEIIKSGTYILDYIHDFATLWNLRKEEFIKNSTPEQMKIELDISQRVLMSNHKSYWAFHHRRWIYEYLNIFDMEKEILVCNALLESDSRNFHAWRHRRWAVIRSNKLFDSELEMTTKLISKNFSNYSAWHYRSQLPNLIINENELDMTKSAIWTDPRDQSAYFYYRWLINTKEISSNINLIENEILIFDDLIIEEPNCKYPYLTLIWLERKLNNPNLNKINLLKSKLILIDAIRAPFYNEQ